MALVRIGAHNELAVPRWPTPTRTKVMLIIMALPVFLRLRSYLLPNPPEVSMYMYRAPPHRRDPIVSSHPRGTFSLIPRLVGQPHAA